MPYGLSASEVDEVISYFDCFVLSERDPDMQGFLVRLSSLIVNLCLTILIKWSDQDLESSIGVVFVQIYTILLVTFVSMRNKALSISDSHFALALTISPLAVYFVYSSTRFLFNRRKPGLLFLRLSYSFRPIVVASSYIMVCLWLTLQLLIYFGREYVFDAQDHTFTCSRPTFKAWVFYRFVEVLIYMQLSKNLAWIVPGLFVVYAVRHCVDIWREGRRRLQGVVAWESKAVRWMQPPLSAIRCMSVSTWIVVNHSHPWFFALVVIGVYLSWASAIGVTYISMTKFYKYISDDIHDRLGAERLWFDPNPDDDSIANIFSYGQMLAGGAAVQPVYAVLKLGWIQKYALGKAIVGLPQDVWDGVVYFLTGKRNPWEKVRERKLEEETIEANGVYAPVHMREQSTSKSVYATERQKGSSYSKHNVQFHQP